MLDGRRHFAQHDLHLQQGEVLPQTPSRPDAERSEQVRQVVGVGLQPPFGPEAMGVLEVLLPVEVGRPAREHQVSLAHQQIPQHVVLQGDPGESRNHVVVVPESFVDEGLQVLQVGKGLHFYIFQDARLPDLFPEGLLHFGVNGEVVETHGHQVASGVEAGQVEHCELLDEFFRGQSFLGVEEFFADDLFEDGPALLGGGSKFLFQGFLEDRLGEHQIPVGLPIDCEEAQI